MDEPRRPSLRWGVAGAAGGEVERGGADDEPRGPRLAALEKVAAELDLEIRDHVVWRGAIFVGGRLTLAGEPGRGVWVFGAASAASVEVGDNSHLCFSSQALQATRELDPRLRPITTRIACWRD